MLKSLSFISLKIKSCCESRLASKERLKESCSFGDHCEFLYAAGEIPNFLEKEVVKCSMLLKPDCNAISIIDPVVSFINNSEFFNLTVVRNW